MTVKLFIYLRFEFVCGITIVLLEMIALSAVQSFARILIHNGIFLLTPQQCLVQQRSLANQAAMFGDNF